MNYILWIIVLVVMLVVEASTVNLVSIWFAAGALGAIISVALGANLMVQIITFVCISALALIIARPIIKKHIKTNAVPTNADRFIGQTGIVTEEINMEKFAGQVKVSGRDWSAVTNDKTTLAVGTKVKVKEISGVKLIVEKEKGE